VPSALLGSKQAPENALHGASDTRRRPMRNKEPGEVSKRADERLRTLTMSPQRRKSSASDASPPVSGMTTGWSAPCRGCEEVIAICGGKAHVSQEQEDERGRQHGIN